MIVLTLKPNGTVTSFATDTWNADHMRVLHLKRSSATYSAVMWFYKWATEEPVNEPATRIARWCGAIGPWASIRGPVFFTGPDEPKTMEIQNPPAWIAEACWRYGYEERQRRKPKPSLERLERQLDAGPDNQ
jgi:hypothetical protein